MAFVGPSRFLTEQVGSNNWFTAGQVIRFTLGRLKQRNKQRKLNVPYLLTQLYQKLFKPDFHGDFCSAVA
jgi:hypothetical protein